MKRRPVALAVVLAIVAAGMSPVAAAEPGTYLVGAAVRSITPEGAVNVGGSGLGDGSVIPEQLIGPGSQRAPAGETIAARAVVVDDGAVAIAIATVDTQGAFAAYEIGPYGLRDVAEQVAAQIPGLSADNILIGHDHTHSGPDLIGAWGFVPESYLALVAAQTKAAIVDAYEGRRPATIVAGSDDAGDLIYNQNCTEALNQSPDATFPNNICNPTQERKDRLLRALQARDATTDEVIVTLVAFAAHATLGGGSGLHGDWPQFLADRLAIDHGGVGMALQGAVGRTQPCRPRCSFTDSAKPGYEIPDRKSAYVEMLSYHVRRALLGAPPVTGPVSASKTFIRHQVTNAFLAALLLEGEAVGAPIARSRQAPWLVGNTVRTPVSAYRIGNLLLNGAPGEAYPNIGHAVVEATNVADQRHWTISLADDQLGYLIAPVEVYPFVTSQIAVNDNSIFNVDPGIGDHVTCAQIRLAGDVGFPTVRPEPRCLAWDTVDAAGDPLA
jgi:hypothetical protein